jgi:amino acid transporter
MCTKPALRLFPLICVMYLVVSGGPYGIEDAIGCAGPRLAFLLCLVVPLSISLPTALMAAELTALLPLEGGFYFWVKEALGPFAGFAEAYLTILYTAVDTAIYPVLFVSYAAWLLPMGTIAQVILAIIVVWLCGLLNILGVRLVGLTSIVWVATVLAPFIVLVALGLPTLFHSWLPAAIPSGKSLTERVGEALTVIIWNFCGWENLSVVADEIEDPRRNYLRAVTIGLPVVTLGYLLPVLVCVQGPGGGTGWHTGAFAEHGLRIGGRWLGNAIAVGGAASSFAIFEAALLWLSRLPLVLAHENYLPAALGKVWPGRQVPVRCLLLCCVIFSLIIPLGFLTLVVFDVFFYMAALMLEMAALILLRKSYPRRDGLFVIRGGRATLYAVALAPMVTWAATLGLAASRSPANFLIALIAALFAALAFPSYRFLQRRFGGSMG